MTLLDTSLRGHENSVANLHRKEFDMLPFSQQIAVSPIRLSQMSEATEFVAAHFPDVDLADFARIRSVVTVDRMQVQLFYRFKRLVGLYAMLFLNSSGRNALLTGNFDGIRPKLSFLASKNEVPAAIYSWMVICPGRAAAGIGNVSAILNTHRYRRADLFARPATPEGLRILRGTGHQPVTADPNGLYRYTRLANRRMARDIAA